jgi:uncharacterized membrane protein
MRRMGFGKGFGAKGMMAKGGFFKGIFGFVGGIFKLLFFGIFLFIFLIVGIIIFFAMKKRFNNPNGYYDNKYTQNNKDRNNQNKNEDDIIDVEIVDSYPKKR